MVRPVRLTLSRAAGFDLQAASLACNGLEARSVARPGPFGNPFTVTQLRESGWGGNDVNLALMCVDKFRRWLDGGAAGRHLGHEAARKRLLERLPELRGKNLACWCKAGAPCHADVLLELANS